MPSIWRSLTSSLWLIVHGLIEAIVVVAPTADEASRAALRRQAPMIRDASFEQFAEPWDRDRIANKLEAAENALAAPPE